ncbi:hypothetical protein M409DRAFT_61326 [Zasmidium cellare ATCC 36951]|uniref:Uncharacterized protein n=1 Tax=Zasmidium cellare ATCC 36951 TaxID=1080233 RepID=A0A6A6BY08_ZASCE|nr:uncharacterized protein M409DRAFT_61326 [Zasmidium cellare ATCC 36951]KAF2158820.1 hypothetical protein M409DRAFT_61326 [Zasmidium cellare ATCC 36951]
MVKSSIGSNFHRRSGDDERRGVFSKLPPLLIPNSLRRLTSPRHDSKDATPLKSSTSSAIVGIGSVLAQVPSNPSTTSFHQGSSAATSTTPTSALPLSALSPFASTRNSGSTPLTTPGSGRPGTINFDTRPGILPDASPGKAYFPIVHAVPDSQAKVITWEERKYNTSRRQSGSEDEPVLMQRCSNTSDAGTGPRIYDASLNRVEVDDISDDEKRPIQDQQRLQATSLRLKDSRTRSNEQEKDKKTQSPPISWDPSDPGHDTWNESGRDEKWQQRSQLFSNLSAFNLRNAQKRKSPPPKQDIGPLCEGLDPTNDPTTLKDAGGLTTKTDDRSETTAKSDAAMPAASLKARSLSEKSDGDVPPETPRVVVSVPNENHPRFAVAMPSSDTTDLNAQDGQEDGQSLFDLSDTSSETSSDEELANEDEDAGEDEHDEELEAISPLPNDENTLTPFPRLASNPIAVSMNSRTGKDSLRASSVLRRTSSTSAAMRPVRSRGELIGLEDCSQSPMVLAAGFEKKPRSGGLTTGNEGNQRECFVYRASGDVGREVWEAVLDHTQPFYGEDELTIGSDKFAHGGTGFVVSRPALQTVVDFYAAHKAEVEAKSSWTPEFPMTDIFPTMQGEHPGFVTYGNPDSEAVPEEAWMIWCSPAISYHHMSVNVVEKLWRFEQRWSDDRIPTRHTAASGWITERVERFEQQMRRCSDDDSALVRGG